ncbi:MAG: M23 family metallopeptidase [Thermodesulfobacteriota bacterium]
MKKKTAAGLLALLLIIIIVAAVIWVFPKMEGEPPAVTFPGLKPALGAASEFAVVIADSKNGLKSASVTLLAAGQEHALADFSSAGSGEIIASKQFDISLAPKKAGIPDGPATLRVQARDSAWRGWFKGNLAYVEKEVAIDTKKPEVEVLTPQHYINKGGVGLVIYRVLEPDTVHGVQVGDRFFPGRAGQFEDANICLGFFAVAYDQPPDVSPMVQVTDAAGNITRAGFYHLIKPKVFAEDLIPLSDGFLNTVMPAFDVPVPDDRPIETFKYVNTELRIKNDETIRSVCRQSDNQQHWQGVFVSFPNATCRAAFGDHRTYQYQGQVVSQAYHLGVDLASLAKSPVPAGNAGRVAFAGDLGIYGRAVIIDHGLGLFSLYGHLSQISVAEDQMVSRGETIGLSGQTGLAGGDHLHYSMLLQDTFINPIEWWDESWITNNINSKKDMIRNPPAGS